MKLDIFTLSASTCTWPNKETGLSDGSLGKVLAAEPSPCNDYTPEIETTSRNEQKQDRSSFVYLSVNDRNSKSNKMKPTEKRKFKDFSRISTVF